MVASQAHNLKVAAFESRLRHKIRVSTQNYFLISVHQLKDNWVVYNLETADNQDLYRRFESSVTRKITRPDDADSQ